MDTKRGWQNKVIFNLEAATTSTHDHQMGKFDFCTHLKPACPVEVRIQQKSRSHQQLRKEKGVMIDQIEEHRKKGKILLIFLLTSNQHVLVDQRIQQKSKFEQQLHKDEDHVLPNRTARKKRKKGRRSCSGLPQPALAPCGDNAALLPLARSRSSLNYWPLVRDRPPTRFSMTKCMWGLGMEAETRGKLAARGRGVGRWGRAREEKGKRRRGERAGMAGLAARVQAERGEAAGWISSRVSTPDDDALSSTAGQEGRAAGAEKAAGCSSRTRRRLLLRHARTAAVPSPWSEREMTILPLNFDGTTAPATAPRWPHGTLTWELPTTQDDMWA